jgi:2-aminoethylphosphonate-pyruvate transaminase
MDTTTSIAGRQDKILFTPGPLTTSHTVKQAMQRDLGSRDFEFIQLVQNIRLQLLEVGEVADRGYETIIMQGSGTFGIEAVVSSVTPPDGTWLVIINGAYGRRIDHIANFLKIETIPLIYEEDRQPDLKEIEVALAANAAITNVAVVHCETTCQQIWQTLFCRCYEQLWRGSA